MLSAREYPSVIEYYISKEVRLGRLIPLPASVEESSVHISPFGVIPQKGRPGQWRLIVDLSSPDGSSVNEGINSEWTSLHYASIDEAVAIILTIGAGCLMAKLDLKSAYRYIPVHPDDRPLLGTRWNNCIFLDAALPFGLASAPKIFSAVADFILWVMRYNGIQWIIHYLDDYLVFGPPAEEECSSALQLALACCAELGWEAHKVGGPASCLTFLGIELDSVHSQLRLPRDKLVSLKRELAHWATRRTCKKRQLLSLIGQLSHASKVIKPGRSFLRRLIDLSKSAVELHHHIRLNASARADIKWWLAFAEEWNGASFFVPPSSPHVQLYSDASGGWGYGAVCSTKWFSAQWPASWVSTNIAVKELLPIVLAAAIWGGSWSRCRITCY